MRRVLPHAVALLLGIAAAMLASCSGTSTEGGIPAASAGELMSQITDVRQAVDDGRCEDVDGQLRDVEEGIEALPSTVDARLRSSLGDAGERLRAITTEECETQTTETETTETQTTETQTQTTETPPTQTQPTETQPTEPPTTPPPVTPPPVTPPPPPPPPATPPPSGGGASPPVQP